jgi:flavin reductase (DIM6/NTAB) family NADH-FMN oxidoreductase RutF
VPGRRRNWGIIYWEGVPHAAVIKGEKMEKIRLSPRTFLYPMPTVLIGANVSGEPNYTTIAYCGIAQNTPPMISVASAKVHYSNAGIKENKSFSVNIPSENMVKAVDFMGLNSGRSVDKSAIFEHFYGTLKTAPMIKECPLNLECRLVTIVDLKGGNEFFIGEIVAAYAEEKFLTSGIPDVTKIRPIIFSMHDNNYWKLGDHLGRAWNIGKDFHKEPGEKRENRFGEEH